MKLLKQKFNNFLKHFLMTHFACSVKHYDSLKLPSACTLMQLPPVNLFFSHINYPDDKGYQ